MLHNHGQPESAVLKRQLAKKKSSTSSYTDRISKVN
jgi:hypothetical protein